MQYYVLPLAAGELKQIYYTYPCCVCIRPIICLLAAGYDRKNTRARYKWFNIVNFPPHNPLRLVTRRLLGHTRCATSVCADFPRNFWAQSLFTHQQVNSSILFVCRSGRTITCESRKRGTGEEMRKGSRQQNAAPQISYRREPQRPREAVQAVTRGILQCNYSIE